MTTLAITGTTGFIGKAIVDSLSFPQRRFVRPSSVSKYKQLFSENKQVEVFVGDLQNPKDCENFLMGVDVLIHLACGHNPRSKKEPIESEIKNHLIPTVNLFERFAQLNANGHIVFASTGGNMYADTQPWHPRTENESPFPRSFYASEKLAAENYLRLFCEQYGVRGTVLRISNPYGMVLPSNRSHGLIGIGISCLLNNEPLTIIDPWETMRDYIHLKDLQSAFQAVLTNPPKSAECNLFNVSSGTGYSIQDILNKLEKIAGKEIHKIYQPANPKHISWSVLSNNKIESQLGWKPCISLDDGLEDTWNKSVLGCECGVFA